MKKMTAAVLALLMLLALSTAALADGDTVLSTTVPDASYTLNIPENQTITYGATSTDIGNVTITESTNFADGKNVEVALAYDGVFTSTTTETTIPYSLKLHTNGNRYATISPNVTLAFHGKSDGSVEDGATYTGPCDDTGNYQISDWVESINLIIKSTDWGKAPSGDYSATITFTSQIVNE